MGLYISKVSLQALVLSHVAMHCSAAALSQDSMDSLDVDAMVNTNNFNRPNVGYGRYRNGGLLDNLGLNL